jgi:hypothetical protein
MSNGIQFPSPRLSPRVLGWLGLALVAVLSVTPLLLNRAGVGFVAPYSTAGAAWVSKAIVLLAMGLAVAMRVRADRADEPWAGRLAVLCVALAAYMTRCHWQEVDAYYHDADGPWSQTTHYLDFLDHRLGAPQLYRPLPYGFIRGLEWFTGDWLFACLAYRWFFTYWFLWASYRFARLFRGPHIALVVLLLLPLFYPASIQNYMGQPTDPVSHALFVLALIYLVRDRSAALGLTLFLGVLAKETVVLLVPAYLACYWRQGKPAFLKTACLGAVCVAAFLAARLPYGWRPSYAAINGTSRLMIVDNLGFGPGYDESPYHPAAAPHQNYVQPLLFVGTFLPFIAWRWRWLDGRLKAIFVTVTPLLLLSSLCFSWLYESRNYMPLLPLLATMAIPAWCEENWPLLQRKAEATAPVPLPPGHCPRPQGGSVPSR